MAMLKLGSKEPERKLALRTMTVVIYICILVQLINNFNFWLLFNLVGAVLLVIQERTHGEEQQAQKDNDGATGNIAGLLFSL